MSYRASYRQDPGLCDRVFELLEVAFPGVSRGRRNGEAFGVPWELSSTPFVVRGGDRVVSHVGLLRLPLRIMGRDQVVGGVHGVATHPDFRRRGLFRGLLEELIAFAEPSLETLVLTTLHPEYFEAFGFRVIPEWIGRASPAVTAPISSRRLDLTTAADLAVVHSLIDRRAPVSDRLGVRGEKACWGFVEFGSTIKYAEALDVAVVAEQSGTTLRVYDVLATKMPSVDRIVGIWGEPIDQVLLFFATDAIAGPWVVEPQDLGGGAEALSPGDPNWVLMARGPFAAEGERIMLPRPARC